MRKYQTKAKLEIGWANSELCISMSDVKVLFRSPTSFIFVECNTLLSLGLFLLPVSSSPWHVSHNSGISSILGSPRQSRFHFHSFTQWTLCALASGTFLSHRGRSYNFFLLSLALKPDPVAEVSKFCYFLGLEHGSLLQLHVHQISVFYGYLQCLSLAAMEHSL